MDIIKRHLNLIKKAIVFILGSIILGGGTGVVLYYFFGDALNKLTELQIRELAKAPFSEIMASAFRLYVVAYVIFSLLPPKIKQAKFVLKSTYFALLYWLCWLICLWI